MNYDNAIRKFTSIRDTFTRIVNLLELVRAAAVLQEEDVEFLESKLGELKNRVEEISSDKQKKPEYTPPPTVADPAEKSVDTDAIKMMYAPSPVVNAAIMETVGIHPGDCVYGVDSKGKQIKFRVLSCVSGRIYVKDIGTNVIYFVLEEDADKYLTLSTAKEYLSFLKPI